MGRYSYAKAVLEKCLSMQPDNEDTKKELELVKSKMDEMPDINQMLRNMNMGGMGGMGMGMGMHSNPYQKSLEDQEKEDFEKAVVCLKILQLIHRPFHCKKKSLAKKRLKH